jgi:glycosyltransferase involved in cell wall biosynthesis
MLRKDRMGKISVIIPAYNESGAVGDTVGRVRRIFESSDHECEVIVVDDGSSDATAAEAAEAGATVVVHPHNIGYGNAIMSGVDRAGCDLIGLTDADGTYPVEELPSMVDEVEARRWDMLVGARQGKHYHGSTTKRIARSMFKFLAEFTTGTRIPDINSGLRVFRRHLVDDYRSVLCGGFSFTTTITIIAMLTQHFVAYRPVPYFARHGRSKVHYFRDTLRTAQILTMTVLIFNPIKLYILLAGLTGSATIPLAVAAAIFPRWAASFVVLGLLLAATCVIVALGFQAEQHRASPRGVFTFQRSRTGGRAARRESKAQPPLPDHRKAA